MDPDKAHGCGGISIHMLKSYATSKPVHSGMNECFPSK